MLSDWDQVTNRLSNVWSFCFYLFSILWEINTKYLLLYHSLNMSFALLHTQLVCIYLNLFFVKNTRAKVKRSYKAIKLKEILYLNLIWKKILMNIQVWVLEFLKQGIFVCSKRLQLFETEGYGYTQATQVINIYVRHKANKFNLSDFQFVLISMFGSFDRN